MVVYNNHIKESPDHATNNLARLYLHATKIYTVTTIYRVN